MDRYENNDNIENVYSKAMIGLHANNPQRITIFNESRPFLNLLFVNFQIINSVLLHHTLLQRVRNVKKNSVVGVFARMV